MSNVVTHILHTKDIGSVSAYGDAREGGYDGTRAQFYSLVKGIVDGAMLIEVGSDNIELLANGWVDGEYDLTGIFPANRYLLLTLGIDGDEASGTQINDFYNAEMSLIDGNKISAHGTVPLQGIPVTITFQRSDAEMVVPTQSGTLTYTGQSQSVTWNNYDTDAMTVSGQTSGTNAGTYTAVFTLNSGYRWTDGSKQPKNVTWSIGKANGSVSLSTVDVEVDDVTTSATVNVLSSTGTITVESADTSLVTASVSNNVITVQYVNGSSGITQVNVYVAASDNYNATSTAIGVYANYKPLYGVTWAGTSSPAFTRTDDAALFTDPVAALDNGNGSSPFDEILPWSGMKIVEDANAGTLVSIPKFYYKWTKSGTRMSLQISPREFTGSHVSPAHADRGDGHGERDIVYVGRYQCDSTFKSTSGSALYNATRSTFRTGIHALGSDLWHEDFAMYWTIRMLYLVEYATWSFASVIGYNNSTVANQNGVTDNMVYHTGTTAATRSAQGAVQYRHIEFGGKSPQYDGIYFSGRGVYIIKNPANFADSSGGVVVGSRTDTNSYISAYAIPTASGLEYALFPSAASGAASTYVCARTYYNTSANNYLAGNVYTNDGNNIFYWSGAALNYAIYGSRLMKLPNG